MLFRLEQNKSVFDTNPGLVVIDEFSKLTEKQMIAVILVADYDSPLKSLQERKRREKACEVAGYAMEGDRLSRNAREFVYGRVATMEKALEKYRELQYDEDRDTLEAIDAQIQEAVRMMKMDKFEGCKVETTRVTADGTTTTTSYIDNEKAFKLAELSIKLGTRLEELRETKRNILSKIKKDETYLPIETYTSADIADIEPTSGMSTLDMFNQKRMEQPNE